MVNRDATGKYIKLGKMYSFTERKKECLIIYFGRVQVKTKRRVRLKIKFFVRVFNNEKEFFVREVENTYKNKVPAYLYPIKEKEVKWQKKKGGKDV